MTTEEKIVELENNCKAMTEELEKLKAELTKKDKNEIAWFPVRMLQCRLYDAAYGLHAKNINRDYRKVKVI